ncbi:MAG: M48 family metallopeptidase [Dehalococcoidia bacterium]|jgi:STE24 endopeptidase
MNIFAVIILAALILEYLLDLASNILNLKALKLEPPAALKDIYSPDAYRKSQEYTRENTRFGLVTGAFSLVLLLAFWFSGGFNWLDQAVRSCGLGSIINGLLYTGILLLAYNLVMLPFSIYATFVIEQHYGFNRTTPRTFVTDRLKALLLAAILGAPLLACILALFEMTGIYAWLYCWAALTIYLLVIEFIAPNWIMPLFNKFTPLEEGELRSAIISYAKSVKFPISNVYVIDGSRRSSKSNAFFTGFGRNKRIALFDTLIAQHTVPELVAVLAHEIGHYKKKHILWGLITNVLHFGILLFLLSLFIHSPGLYQAFYVQQPSIYTGLIFFGLLYTPIELVLSVFMNMLSRKFEYDADRFAALTVPDAERMVDSLKKLSRNNLSNLTPHPFYVFLHYTHPPLLQRTRAIQISMEKAGGRLSVPTVI